MYIQKTASFLEQLEVCMYVLGVCDYQDMWYHDFADYCLESIAINRLTYVLCVYYVCMKCMQIILSKL